MGNNPVRHDKEFWLLRKYGQELKSEQTLSVERLEKIQGHIEVCDHLKNGQIDEYVVRLTKKLLEYKIKKLQKIEKAKTITDHDRDMLRSLRIENDFEKQGV